MKTGITAAPELSMPHTTAIKKDPCIVWSNGTGSNAEREPLCTIERDDLYKMYVRAAENFYQASFGGIKALSFEINHTAGLGEISAWRDISARLTEGYLSRLQEKGVGQPVLDLVRENLDLEGAATRFDDLAKRYGAKEADIRSAHEVASEAHAQQTFARPQDTQGLFHIPYVQHPINMGLYAMKLSLPASAVMKALLHDVVEDTDVESATLAKRFDSDVVNGVGELTKSPNQSRKEFLAHVKELRGETAVIKGLDRYDNLIRVFAIEDSKYHQRVLSECAAVYDDIFKREPGLQVFRSDYELLKKELQRFSL
ncbi:unannotated protein [freshwater metagenome]|uniref:Unannotated protein n=1 Tax=freshwater metagenome TaxID=449393 RepID=A0A6J6ZHA5_9ZZZZ|nr:HD domain-containing protein [Actinomycetota bacterium]RLS40341.1 MAG: HD domain-containing protein [Planctomycetota bacterium]